MLQIPLLSQKLICKCRIVCCKWYPRWYKALTKMIRMYQNHQIENKITTQNNVLFSKYSPFLPVWRRVPKFVYKPRRHFSLYFPCNSEKWELITEGNTATWCPKWEEMKYTKKKLPQKKERKKGKRRLNLKELKE